MSEDCEVILPTPEHRKKKPRRGVSKYGSHHRYSPAVDVNPHTSEELLVMRKMHNLIPNNEPLTSNLDTMMSFIFHNHEEFLSYTEDCVPKHNSIKMVGILKNNSCQYFLKKYSHLPDGSAEIYVIMNVRNLRSLPRPNDRIEACGFLGFKTFRNKKLPVLIVRFWRNLTSCLADYLRCLEIQKMFIPSNYKDKQVTEIDDMTFLNAVGEITLIFNEVDADLMEDGTNLKNNQQESDTAQLSSESDGSCEDVLSSVSKQHGLQGIEPRQLFNNIKVITQNSFGLGTKEPCLQGSETSRKTGARVLTTTSGSNQPCLQGIGVGPSCSKESDISQLHSDFDDSLVINNITCLENELRYLQDIFDTSFEEDV